MAVVKRPTLRPTRRQLLKGVAGLGLATAGGTLLGGCANQVAPFFSSRTGDQLETTRIRLVKIRGLCHAPQATAEDLLRAEGFTDVQYVGRPDVSPIVEIRRAVSVGEADLSMNFTALNVMSLEDSEPVVILGGIHTGCFELFGTDQVRAIRDLKGKTIALADLGTGSSQHIFLGLMLAYVGLDPARDVQWVTQPFDESMRLLADGKVDAFLGFPPEAQMVRASNIGHSVMNSAQDRPWSQYFCCTIVGNRDFVQHHPVATKRALRAMLKATDLCASEPERVAQTLFERGVSPTYDVALQVVRDVPYGSWREYDPEDAVRFWALRLHEAGMIKSAPDAIIQKGTNWTFFNELKRELKG